MTTRPQTSAPAAPPPANDRPLTPREWLSALWEHAEELRKRLMISVIGLAVTVTASFWLSEIFLRWLAFPLPGGLQAMQAIEVTENISVFMRISLLSGFILALPLLAYELLAFLLPGLQPREKRWLGFLIPTATVLFLLGVAFAYFVMLPVSVPFLLEFMDIPTVVRPANYIGFATNLLFWTGVIFQTPLVVFGLAKFGFVTAAQLLRGWRIAIVVSAVLAAFITPTVDPVSMALLMLPLILLYLLSVLFARFAGK